MYKDINVNLQTGADMAITNKLFDAMVTKMQSAHKAFGENLTVAPEVKANMISTLSRTIFDKELKAAGEYGVGTNAGINSRLRGEFIRGLKEEFDARANALLTGTSESFFQQGIASQLWQVYSSNTFNADQQLLLMSLAPAVIKPIYNKIVKSIVTKDIFFERKGFLPVVYDEQGRAYNFFDLVNSIDEISELKSGGQPTIKVEVPLDGGKIKDPQLNSNLCHIYNRTAPATEGEYFKQINDMHDFIAAGVKITSLTYDDGGEKKIAVDYMTVNNPTQSGQISKQIAAIGAVFKAPKAGAPDIKLAGRLDADGELLLMCTDEKVKKIEFQFIVPVKGAEQPLKVYDVETKFQQPIQQVAVASTTTNEQLIEDVKLRLSKDIIARFNETSVKIANAQKDAYLLSYISNHLNDMAKKEALIKSSKVANAFANEESYAALKTKYSYKVLDMNSSNYGYTDVNSGHTALLARTMYDTMNEIDVVVNPEQKQFAMYSCSAAAQWVKTPEGQNSQNLQYVGDVVSNDGTIAGFSTPAYELQMVKVGNLYSTRYIVTNKLEKEEVVVDTITMGGAKSKSISNKYRYFILPYFEDTMDSIIFLNGLERVTQGVNDVEYRKDMTLNYYGRFDIAIYNKSAAAVDLIESPISSYVSVK